MDRLTVLLSMSPDSHCTSSTLPQTPAVGTHPDSRQAVALLQPPKLSPVDVMDAAFAGAECEGVDGTGAVLPLPAHHWLGDPDRGDHRLFLDHCTGSTLDVGCGPGRLVGALAARRLLAMGIDVSGEAVRQARARGAHAVLGDVFGAVPRSGEWDHVLLADGNIGIGGDPVRLLDRVHGLLRTGGTAFVEVDPASVGLVLHRLRLRVGAHTSAPFRWASVGADAVRSLAAEAALDVTGWRHAAGRCVAVVSCGCPDGRCRAPGGAST